MFKLIERSAISPQEMERMKDEYNLEEVQQKKYLAGRKEGLKEGHQTGQQESQLMIAKNMLKKGLEPELVHEVTGVPMETIQTLSL